MDYALKPSLAPGRKNSNLLNKVIKRINYFGDNSNLHGIKNVISSKPIHVFKRSWWLIFVCLSLLGVLYILHQASDLFEHDAISFVPETTYLQWNTDFPAITVCETADNDKLTDYYEENDVPIKLTTFHKEIIFLDSQHYCRSCSSCSKIGGCPEDFYKLINKYRSPCNETIARCSWNGKAFDCCERFDAMPTEFGKCFVFNSAHFDERRMHISNRSTGPGFLKFAAMETVTIDVHSPDDVVFSAFDKQVISGNKGYLPFGSEFELRFKVEETSNDPMVHEVPTRMRKCLFAHEKPAIHMYPRYSYSVCILQCRARRQMAKCNCTHHMLPRIENEPVCDINGLTCLTEYIEEHLENDDLDEGCDCLPSCDEPSYRAVFIKNSPNTGALTEELIERGSLISIYMECLPTTRVKRLVVKASLDYVVFVGGTAGIFFGASILSALEIIYLLFLRKY